LVHRRADLEHVSEGIREAHSAAYSVAIVCRRQGFDRHLGGLQGALYAQRPCGAQRQARRVGFFIGTAFAQDDAEAASVQWRRVANQLRPKVPKLTALMDEAEPDVLVYMSFPP
jgi:hypothetical protein